MLKKFFKLSLLLVAVVLLTSACTLAIPKKVEPIRKTNLASNTKLIVPMVSKEKTIYTNKLEKFKDYSGLVQFLSKLNPNNNFISSNYSALLATKADSNNVINNYIGLSPAAQLIANKYKPNIIELSGDYIYVLAHNELSIIKIAPANKSVIVSKITFKSRPQAMLLFGDSLAVYGLDNQLVNQTLYQTFRRKNVYTFLKVFNISDPTNPRLTRDLDFEGSYLSARLLGDQLYFITAAPGIYLTGESPIPRVIDNGQVLAARCDGATKCFVPKVYYFDIPYNSYHFVSVNVINLKNSAVALTGQVYLVSPQQYFYLSPNGLDIIYSPLPNYYNLEQEVKETLFYPKLSPSQKSKINIIRTTSKLILNKYEKKTKIAEIINNYLALLGSKEQKIWQTTITSSTKQKLITARKSLNRTFIYKWGIKDNQLTYQAFGQIWGNILDPSALDQDGDYLRIVTTSSPAALNLSNTGGKHYTSVYILGPNLKIIGRLQNLMTIEKISAIRFLGDRLYLITPKSTDPLFVINLNNPVKPVVLGAIQIPGLVNYLQPLNSNGTKFIVLSGNGKVSYNNGSTAQGLTWSLFDFSNLAKPQELSSYLISNLSGSSMALQDHNTFFYSADDNLLSLPVTLRDKGRLSFTGALVFKITNNQISLQGRVDHSQGAYFSPADYWNGFNYYNDTVLRSLVASNELVTFSNKFLKINSLPSLKVIASQELTTAGDDYIIRPIKIGTTASSSASSSSRFSTTTLGNISASTSSSTIKSSPPISSTTTYQTNSSKP